MKVARSYTMSARAESAAQTAERIVQATRDLFAVQAIADITLSDIAARAGVTAQTVLRRFGDKDGVFGAAFARFAEEVYAQRGQARANDLDDVLANLAEHYEEWGQLMLKMLAEEARTPAVRDTLTAGRDYHHRWCASMFSESLEALPRNQRSRRQAQLTAICDLRTWEQLRIIAGLDAAETRLALREMLEPLVTKG